MPIKIVDETELSTPQLKDVGIGEAFKLRDKLYLSTADEKAYEYSQKWFIRCLDLDTYETVWLLMDTPVEPKFSILKITER